MPVRFQSTVLLCSTYFWAMRSPRAFSRAAVEAFVVTCKHAAYQKGGCQSTQHEHMLVPHVQASALSAEVPMQLLSKDRGHPGESLHAWELAAQVVKALVLSMGN